MREDDIRALVRQLIIDELEIEIEHKEDRYFVEGKDVISHSINISLCLNGKDIDKTQIWEDSLYLDTSVN